jgi:hypothetical protein
MVCFRNISVNTLRKGDNDDDDDGDGGGGDDDNNNFTWRQVFRATAFCTVAPNICGPSVWNLLHVTVLVPRIWKWLLFFFFENLRNPGIIIITITIIIIIIIIWYSNSLRGGRSGDRIPVQARP